MADLKIGVALWSFGPHRTMDEFKRKLDMACEVGAKAVQIWNVDYSAEVPCALDPDRCTGAQRKEITRAVEERGLAISGWCAQLEGPKGFGGFGDQEGLQERITKTRKSIEMAVELGSPIVATHVGEIPEDPSHPDYQVYLKSVGAVCQAVEKIGGIFAPETGQESAACLVRFFNDLGTEAVKCNYDPANMLGHGTVDGVRTLAPYIVHAHAKDLNPTTGQATLGQGDVPWPEYMAAIREIGYAGWHAVEDETGGDVMASLRTGIEFLKSF